MSAIIHGLHRHIKPQSGGLLPAVLALGLAVGIVSLLVLQNVSSDNATTTERYYTALAQDAAQAGTAAAAACFKNATSTWTNAKPLTSASNCAGDPGPQKVTYVAKAPNWRSTYSVSQRPDPSNSIYSIVSSVGKVDLINTLDGSIVKSYTKTSNTYVQTSTLPAATISSLSTGSSTTCAVASGQAYCWGLNSSGQAGLGNTTAKITSPQKVIQTGILAGKPITKISTGNNHTCAVADGKAYCWGNNGSGQLGNQSTTSSSTPVAVSLNPTTTPGVPSTCTKKNIFGTCIQWSTAIPETPASALYNKVVVDIQVGNNYSCALTIDGFVACWGDNTYGQLGIGNRTSYMSPMLATGVIASGGVKKLGTMSGGNQHTCAITVSNTAVCWGRNYSGQTGNDNSLSVDIGSCYLQGMTIGTSADVTSPQYVYTGGPKPGGWFGLGSRPASSLQAEGGLATDIATMSSYTTAIGGATGYAHWWGGDTYELNSCYYDASSYTYMGYDNRYYTSVSRPSGPLYSSNQPLSCWFLNFVSYTCGSSPSALDYKRLRLFSGNMISGVFCAVPDGSNAIYCDAPSQTRSSYRGSLGDASTSGNLTGLPKQAYSASGWLSGKTVTDLKTGVTTSGPDNAPNKYTAYTCAVAGGEVGCWGSNTDGQLGDGSTTWRNTPVAAPLPGAPVSAPTQTWLNPISF